MDFVIHIGISAVSLLLVSRILRGFEIDNIFAALLAAFLLGLVQPFAVPIAEKLGQSVASYLAASQLAYLFKLALLVLFLLVIYALILKLVAYVTPGFRIGGFTYALLAAALLVLINILIGEGFRFAQSLLNPPPETVTWLSTIAATP